MITFAIDDRECTVPDWVQGIHTFCEWAHSDDFPEKGRIWWLRDRVWVDLAGDEIFSHGQIVTEFTSVLGPLAKKGKSGRFLTRGAFLCNFAADIAGRPDSLFLSKLAITDGIVRFVKDSHGEFTELQGSPDMVLEIVSPGSVRKDTVTLRNAYWEAGVKEYWLVDVRRCAFQFDILRQAAKGFQATRKVDGWMKSNVFGKSFRLIQTVAGKLPEYTLEVR